MSLVLALAFFAAQYDPLNPGATPPPAPKPAAASTASKYPDDPSQGKSQTWPAPGPRPATYPAGHYWPTNTKPLYEVFGLTFEEETGPMNYAFERSVVTCIGGCHNKEVYDSKPAAFVHHTVYGKDYYWLEHKIAALKVGESYTWKGLKTTGSITLEGAHDIGDWPCRQTRWTLKRPDGSTAGSKIGLICLAAKMGETKKEWQTIY
jgi:hypothetical protein